MIVEVELPDDTLAGFVNFVYGDMFGITISTLSLTEKGLKNGVSYKTCNNSAEEGDTNG